MQRILLIDDDVNIREVVSLVLLDEGYDVSVAVDGAQALEMVESWQPHVILLDMRMPGMDGWEFARRYRTQYGHQVPIIVMTAAHDAVQRGTEVDAEAIIPKPFDIEFLLGRVAAVVQASGSDPIS
jgi:DNA-binding response OmpR family regulator